MEDREQWFVTGAVTNLADDFDPQQIQHKQDYLHLLGEEK